jgi:hypothetical protein
MHSIKTSGARTFMRRTHHSIESGALGYTASVVAPVQLLGSNAQSKS